MEVVGSNHSSYTVIPVSKTTVLVLLDFRNGSLKFDAHENKLFENFSGPPNSFGPKITGTPLKKVKHTS